MDTQGPNSIWRYKLTRAPVFSFTLFWESLWSWVRRIWGGIGSLLVKQGRPPAFFSEKLCESKRKYSTCDKEFYAIVHCLEHWGHYLIADEFILHSDHEASKYIQG